MGGLRFGSAFSKSLFTIFFVADFSAETGAGKAKSTAKASFGAHF
jgi:hypothetical protein